MYKKEISIMHPVRDINRINFACNCLADMASTSQKYISYNPFVVYNYMYKYDININYRVKDII